MSDKDAGQSRRDFLKLASTAAPAAVAAAAAGSASSAAAQPVDPSSDRIQDTEHTRAYFDSARF